jgi:retinol-binding protein 3
MPEVRMLGRTLAIALSMLAAGVAPSPAQQDIVTLAPELVRQIVESVAKNVAAEYFDVAMAEQASSYLLAQERSGRYRSLVARNALAAGLTRDLFALTRDKHLVVSSRGLAAASPAASASGETREARGRRENFGVRQATVLAGNIGYLDIGSFYRAEEAQDALARAMQTVRDAAALIVDMRENGGGAPDTVALLAGYLFDTPGKPLFEIVSRTGERRVYTSPVPGVSPRNGTRPVFVLTSQRTFSAGEGFAFILQQEHRAIVIGEQTAGAANPGRAYPVTGGLEVTVPNGQVRTAATGSNWEGSGVTPDIVVPAAAALEQAQVHARR